MLRGVSVGAQRGDAVEWSVPAHSYKRRGAWFGAACGVALIASPLAPKAYDVLYGRGDGEADALAALVNVPVFMVGTLVVSTVVGAVVGSRLYKWEVVE